MKVGTTIRDEFSFRSWVMPLPTTGLPTFLQHSDPPHVPASTEHPQNKALDSGTDVWQKSMDTLPPDLTKRDILRYVSDKLFDVMFEVPGEEIFASLAGSPDQILEWARLACAHLNGYGYAGTVVETPGAF